VTASASPPAYLRQRERGGRALARAAAAVAIGAMMGAPACGTSGCDDAIEIRENPPEMVETDARPPTAPGTKPPEGVPAAPEQVEQAPAPSPLPSPIEVRDLPPEKP